MYDDACVFSKVSCHRSQLIPNISLHILLTVWFSFFSNIDILFLEIISFILIACMLDQAMTL